LFVECFQFFFTNCKVSEKIQNLDCPGCGPSFTNSCPKDCSHPPHFTRYAQSVSFFRISCSRERNNKK
jgi:hypothetical protein